jgi:protocatechuate 3,4-dioxygenase beta subunit
VRTRTFAWIALGILVVAVNSALLVRLRGRPPATGSGPVRPVRENLVRVGRADAAGERLLANGGPLTEGTWPRVSVVDAEGEPVPGASIRVEPARRSRARPSEEAPLAEGTTDSHGFWHGPLSARVRARVVVEKAAFAAAEAPVDPLAAEARVVLEKEAVFRGRVLDAKSGAPVAGATVRAGRHEVRAGDDGRFAFAGLRGGRCSVSAWDGDHLSTTREADLAAGLETTLDLPLNRGTVLRGRVTFPGTGLAATEGTVTFAPEDPVRGRTAAIGPDGRFVLRGLPGPQRFLEVATGGGVYVVQGQNVRIDPATGEQIGEIEVPVPRPSPEALAYQGVVRDGEGKPVAGARVVVGTYVIQGVARRDLSPAGEAGMETLTDAGGRYRIRSPGGVGFSGAASGEILVLHPGYAPTHFVLPPRSRNRTFDLVLQRGADVVVEVLDTRGEPARGAEVYTFMIHDDPRTSYSQHGDVAESIRAHPVTDGEGRAVLRHVGPGPWYVAARSADGLEGVRVRIELDGKEASPAVSLGMQRLPSVGGRVVGGSGAPVPGATVSAGMDWSGAWPRTVAGPDGRFSFEAYFPSPGVEQVGNVHVEVLARTGAGTIQGSADIPLGGSSDVTVEAR